MKIVQINTFSNKSTGSIMMSIHQELKKQGHESYIIWGRGRKPKDDHEIYLNDDLGVKFHGLYTRLTDKTGFASKRSTKKLIKILDTINPDIIHLHNIHGYYVNIEMLFDYIKEKNIRTIWTLHDCWAFTGHCPHFELIGCEKWKNYCSNCPQKNLYPKSIKDNSKYNFNMKKKVFTGVKNMTIVTPSNWLANLVKQSFLKDYSVEVINNGIDTNIFKPRESDFRKKYNLENKKILLGVASDWTKEKGFDDFIKLSSNVSDEYQVVMVGLNKKQLKRIPSNIIGIERTDSQIELAEIYSASDVYLNLTYADNYPTTNLEAQACGTPVITYNTGGSPETIKNNYGITLQFSQICSEIEECIKLKARSKIELYDLRNIYSEYSMCLAYIEMYKGIGE